MGVKRSWTSQELAFKLFQQKRCPFCHGKLEHHLKKVYVGVECGPDRWSMPSDTYDFQDRYLCEACHKDFSLSDLINAKRGVE